MKENKKVRNKTLNENSNKRQKKINKKTILIIVGILLGIITLIVILINILNKEENNSNINNNVSDNDSGYLTANKDSVSFKCSVIEPNVENYGGDVSVYGVNDYVYCNINSNNNYNYKINHMELEYNYGNNIDLNNVYSLSDDWKVSKTLGNIEISLLNDAASINDIYFKFYIKNNKDINDKYKIVLENIKFTSNNSDYRIKEDIIIELNTKNNRNIQVNNLLRFDELSSDGSFQTLSEYKCNDDLCMVNAAQQGFQYSNDNPDIVMIYDGNYKILYNIRKGTIINTYGSNSIWLSSNAVASEIEGTYIYIQAKDSEKYGIIDVNGNVIKNFVLDKPPFVNFVYPTTLRYSIENNMLVNIQNGKYGIIEITSDKIIIDYIYDDLDLINKTCFKAKINNKWHVYNISSNQKLIEEGFDNIYYNSDDILIVEKDNTLYIRNYDNKNITNETIKVSKDDTIQAYTDYSDKTIINIHVCSDEYCHEYKERYEYNVNSNKLNKAN